MRVEVMQGSLDEFDLAQVLQVVGIGRQYTAVEVQHDSGLMGTIFVKSGKVVSVEGKDAGGRDAFFRLFDSQHGSFSVFRMETPSALPEPLGAINKLLMEALDAASAPASVPPPLPPIELDPYGEEERPTQAGVAPPPGRHASSPMAPPPLPVRAGVTRRRRTAPAPRPASPHNAASTSVAEPAPTAAPAGAQQALRASPSASPPPARASAAPTRAPAPRSGGAGGPSGRVVTVASPKGGCGKTTVSLNVALSLARQGRSVVLVDADINGDVLSAINARQKADAGVFDVLLGIAELDDAVLDTVLPRFKILPAVGGELPRAETFYADLTEEWRRVLNDLSQRAEIVIVDAPAGMFGVAHQVLSTCTHVVGVLQAEVVANRSFSRFMETIRSMPAERRPETLGVVINMVQTRHSASLSVFQDAFGDLPAEWLFDTSIPRHPAFLDATAEGVPLRLLDEDSPPPVAWLFDNLAAEMVARLGLEAVERRPKQLLL